MACRSNSVVCRTEKWLVALIWSSVAVIQSSVALKNGLSQSFSRLSHKKMACRSHSVVCRMEKWLNGIK